MVMNKKEKSVSMMTQSSLRIDVLLITTEKKLKIIFKKDFNLQILKL